MAAALWEQRLRQHGVADQWRVESAGTWARAGLPAALVAQTVMRDCGVDLSGHRSRCVSRDMLHSFDLILVMERGHREALRIEFPGVGERVYLLSEMVGNIYDIPDPIAGPIAEVRSIAQEIDLLLGRGFERIVEQVTRTLLPCVKSSATC